MKNSILIISTVLAFTFNLNATTLKTNLNTTTVGVEPVEPLENSIKVFDWTVKTNLGKASGTALSLFNAKKMISLFSKGEIIKEMQIVNYYVSASNINTKDARLFYWEVKSDKSFAKGFSRSLTTAKKMIKLVAKGNIISYEIISSEKIN